MQESRIHILWDSSHIWGLMAWRALHALGLTCRITKAQEIASGILAQSADPLLILVPGGNARLKAKALGPNGREQLCATIARGGTYLGFCGGAGLALSPVRHAKNEKKTQDGLLGLCPWSRNPYPDRLQHLISGHVLAHIIDHELCPPELMAKTIALPVWWPGRFLAQESPDVQILARAKCRDHDFWLGDLPLNDIPNHILAIWKAEYGLDLTANFVHNMPLVITGSYGKGRYILSYSHLETPQSPDANTLFAAIVAKLTESTLEKKIIPAWSVQECPEAWPKNTTTAPLYAAYTAIRDLVDLATNLHLFVARTPWLWGWKNGLPGAVINALQAALHAVLSLEPSAEARAYWLAHKDDFSQTFSLFAQSAEESLLTNRITGVLGNILSHKVRRKDRLERQEAIFGCPRMGGGLLGILLEHAEELLYLSQKTLKG